ncbi:MAG: cytochrome c oxidase subunit II [Firmicutes bacterium ZCTH02-B6]|nr:MAG: cytochrome c oxidase subunit II [Firmicutes bacterium ZCTH02-B6]
MLRLGLGAVGAAGAALPAAAAGPQYWLDPAGPVAAMQGQLFLLTLYIMLGIFVTVSGILVYTLVRFRERAKAGARAGQAGTAVQRETAAAAEEELPPQIEGNHKLEVVWTLIPFLLLLIIAIPTVRLSFALAADPGEDALEIRVVGHQWWWEFEYTQLGIVTGNEIRIPVGRPVRLIIQTDDVIHKFWVPKLAGKMDAIPGRTNQMWLQADEPGVYYGQCAELCGTHHANMRMRVVALPPAEFDAWAANWGRGPVVESEAQLAAVERGRQVFETRACFACHTIEGTAAQGTAGPNLTDIGARTTIAAGILDNTPENLARWISDPQAIKPGSLMPRVGLTPDELQDVVAFLTSLR